MATKTMKVKSANAGAAIERGKLLAKLRRMRKTLTLSGLNWEGGYNRALEDIADWVKESAARASKKPGGLGRK